jgi:hypothetical protein
MTGKLEDELRRVLADPPVAAAGVDDIGGTLATLDRRVTRTRARRRAAAGLSVAVVLTGGLAGATILGGGGPAASPSTVSGAYGSAQERDPERGLPPSLPLSEVLGPPPREVLAAARGAVAAVTGGTVSGPVRWVRVGDGYLVQIRFTAPVSCRSCGNLAATPTQPRGPVLEVQVPAAPVPAPSPAATAPGSAPPGAGSDRSAAPQGRTRLLALKQATDLSRYGPVGEFTLPPRAATARSPGG